MGAIIMDRVVVGENALVAAGSLVTEGTIIPDNTLVMGSPAKPAGNLLNQKKASPMVRAALRKRCKKLHRINWGWIPRFLTTASPFYC